MLDKGLRYDFIEKHSRNCTAEQLFRNYQYFYLKYAEGDAGAKVGCFADCLWYLKKLVTKYKPEKVIKLICDIENTSYNEIDIEQGYIYLMNEITRIHLFIDDYQVVAHWAKKTIDMIEYFHPNNAAIDKQYFLLRDDLYKDSWELYQKYKEYFDEKIYKDFVFDWEKEFYSPSFHSNQNVKISL
jgi:hypothetical protein